MQADIKMMRGHWSLEVSLHLTKGVHLLIGPNAAGKTSLCLALLGALNGVQGYVSIQSHVLLDSVQGINKPIEQRKIAYVPQNYALFEHLNVAQNISFAVQASGFNACRYKSWRQDNTYDIIQKLALAPLLKRDVCSLSSGEKQRVALARALMSAPDLLLLDEPFSALDVHVRHEVRLFLCDYLKSLPIPILLITHAPEDARVFNTQMWVIEFGRITQQGPFESLVKSPKSIFVRQFTQQKV